MKAEIFSSDFIIGVTIFLVAVSIFGIYYANIQTDISDYKTRNEIQTKANNIANLLVTSTGEPRNWDHTNVKVIGLYSDGLINLTKFREFKEIEYYTAKKMLGVGGYEFYIELKNKTGYTLKNDSLVYEYGIEKSENALQAFYTERYGITDLNGNITKTIIGVVVWL